MFILDSRDSMPTPMMVNLKHEANDIGADFDVDLFSGLPPPATAMAALPAGREDDATAGPPPPPAPQEAIKAAEVSAAEVAQALVVPSEGQGAVKGSGNAGGEQPEVWAAAAADEESAAEEADSLSGGVEQDRDETPDVPAVDLA